MGVKKGDYIGFSYNGIHSSDLGIVRTSDGSRFNENLLPTMQDKTVQVPGGDGTYYFGSYFTQRQISVSYAFDSLTEDQIGRLKAQFGDKKIHPLIFDERPYLVYSAKVTGTATLKYIPFTENTPDGSNRVYKGEGTIQFTCYQPYATCNKKWLNEYSDWDNIQEWSLASGLKVTQGSWDKVSGNKINVYNPGDIEAHFILNLSFNNGVIPSGKIYINEEQLEFSEIAAQGNDSFIKINTRLNLIEGYTAEGIKSGNIYNHHIIGGSFFKIPLGENVLYLGDLSICANSEQPIEYSYYYF